VPQRVGAATLCKEENTTSLGRRGGVLCILYFLGGSLA